MTAAAPGKTEAAPPPFSFVKLIGPGLMVAAAGIGAGDIIASTLAGAGHGLALLWVVAAAAFLKCFLNEGIARWQLATDTTAVEGWCTHMHWSIRAFFGAYLVLWTVSVGAGLTGAAGLGLANLTHGAVPRPWGAVAHSLVGGAFVLLGGFSGFERVMKVLIGTMFFSIVACAVLTFPSAGAVAVIQGLVVPSVPPGARRTVLSLLGGIGGTVSMLAYGYWLREEKMAGPRWVSYVRWDVTIAYVFTALFGMSVMVVANQAFHVPAVPITNAQAVTRMADTLGRIIGPAGFWAYSIGFWAAVFASLLGIWQSIPYLFADYYGMVRGYPRQRRQELTAVSSTPYRLALAFIALAPIPFAFIDQPLLMVRTFTIVGSLFIPFLTGTLLYLNNLKLPRESGVPRNSLLTNAVLAAALLLFGVVGAAESGLLPR
jgi:Mn2+/Fe2+ NRAMP family transporter